MPKHAFGRFLAVAILLGALALSGPAHAATRSPAEGGQGFWGWLSRLWETGISTLFGDERNAPRSGRGTGGLEKAGVCIDPNGCGDHSTASPSGGTCSAWNEAGVCIDPNG